MYKKTKIFLMNENDEQKIFFLSSFGSLHFFCAWVRSCHIIQHIGIWYTIYYTAVYIYGIYMYMVYGILNIYNVLLLNKYHIIIEPEKRNL